MREKQESRPGVSSTGAAVETAAIGVAAVPEINFTIPGGGGQQFRVADFLLSGQENAIPLKHLTQLTGLRNRDLRRRIQLERLAGIPILSDNISGYFLPATDYEKQRFVTSMRGRAAEIEAVAAAVEGAAGAVVLDPKAVKTLDTEVTVIE